MIDTASLASGLVGALAGVIVAAFLNYWLQSKAAELARKLDVLRRLSANRHLLTERGLRTQPIGEPFCALNEAVVVFTNDQNVIQALKCMQDNPGQASRDIPKVIKEMYAACGCGLSGDHESLIERPFTPGEPAQGDPPPGT